MRCTVTKINHLGQGEPSTIFCEENNQKMVDRPKCAYIASLVIGRKVHNDWEISDLEDIWLILLLKAVWDQQTQRKSKGDNDERC